MSMTPASPILFGDLLAWARRNWVDEMARRLGRLGHHDYRRSDALTLRCLRHGPTPLSELSGALGVTRQAARKVIEGLVARGYVRVERDRNDGRRLNVELTASGEDYASDLIDVIQAINEDLDGRIDPYDLVVAKAVLRVVNTLYGTDGKNRS
jgi:DNA-binding MarR family transcriptional regulator